MTSAEPGGTSTTGLFSTRWHRSAADLPEGIRPEVVLDCGWGRVVFGQTFTSQDKLRAALRAEESGHRDICIYPRDPHVLVAQSPAELFLDPSHTFRLDLTTYRRVETRSYSRIALRLSCSTDRSM